MTSILDIFKNQGGTAPDPFVGTVFTLTADSDFVPVSIPAGAIFWVTINPAELVAAFAIGSTPTSSRSPSPSAGPQRNVGAAE